MFCQKCGNRAEEGAAFCQKCGAKIVHADTVCQTTDATVPMVEPSATNIAEPSPITSSVPVQTMAKRSISATYANNFKMFVDNHVRTTTKFRSADDLLKSSKPLLFIWPCIAIPAIFGLINMGPVGLLLFGGIFGYVAVFIASGIIRMRYSGKYSGEFTGDINIDDLFDFLNGRLKHIHPDFNEWGYLSKKGLLPILENAIANATEEVRICSEFGSKRKNLITLYIKPKTIDAKPGEKLYFVDALKNGFLVDGRAAGFLGHGTLIRTAPILQASMEYYIKSKGYAGNR